MNNLKYIGIGLVAIGGLAILAKLGQGQIVPQPPEQPRECTENTSRCNNGTVQKCISGKWINFKTCDYGCNPATNDCAPAPPPPPPPKPICTEGETRCNGNNIEQCQNGNWFGIANCGYFCDNGQCKTPTANITNWGLPGGQSIVRTAKCCINCTDSNCIQNNYVSCLANASIPVSDIVPSVTISNTSPVQWNFGVGCSIRLNGTTQECGLPGKSTNFMLSGEQKTITFDTIWMETKGDYDIRFSVWAEQPGSFQTRIADTGWINRAIRIN